MSQPPEERATDRPEVTTVPAEPPRQRRLPAHLGRARTSTLILSVLFLAIGALWLNVRPDPVATTPAGGGSDVQQSTTPEPTPPTTEAPTTEPVEPTESEAPTTEAPTTEAPEETLPTPTSGVPSSPRTTVEPTLPPSPSG
jgi:hypothetical protein